MQEETSLSETIESMDDETFWSLIGRDIQDVVKTTEQNEVCLVSVVIFDIEREPYVRPGIVWVVRSDNAAEYSQKLIDHGFDGVMTFRVTNPYIDSIRRKVLQVVEENN